MSAPRTARRALAAAVLALAAAGALAGPAAAHVTVSADDPAKGAPDAILTFRVPNESDTAKTVKVEIKLPVKTPIAAVRPAAPAGWTVATTPVKFDPPIKTDDGTITDGVGTVTFTADAGKGIPAGGFEAFQLLVGPLPDAAAVSFPTVQTYSDGKVDSWVDPVVEGRPEPESPAPTLTLTAADAAPTASAGSTASAAPAPSVSTAPAPSPETSGGTSSDGSGSSNGLGIAGLVLGALGAALGGAAFVRSGRRTAGA